MIGKFFEIVSALKTAIPVIRAVVNILKSGRRSKVKVRTSKDTVTISSLSIRNGKAILDVSANLEIQIDDPDLLKDLRERHEVFEGVTIKREDLRNLRDKLRGYLPFNN